MSEIGRQPRTEASIDLLDDRDEIRSVQEEVLNAVRACGYPEASAFAVRLALEEAICNAFRHGHKNLPHQPVRLRWKIDQHQVCLRITDRGPGFSPDELPDPTADDRIELPAGRGVMLMRAYMSRVEFNEAGNDVTMVYERPSQDLKASG